MIPKALKTKLMAYGWVWNWAKWHDIIIAYVNSYIGLRRRVAGYLTSLDRGDSPEIIAQRLLEMRTTVTYTENKIAEANS